jgi:hypothetical protein
LPSPILCHDGHGAARCTAISSRLSVRPNMAWFAAVER